MSTVIKATDRGAAIHEVAFNLEDMARGADRYLAKIREHAAKILADAAAEAQTLRKRAETEGRQAGQKAVEQMVDQKVAEQMKTALPALKSAAAQIESARNEWIMAWQQRLVKLATAMAAKIARTELTHQPDIPLRLVREALELASGNAQIRVLLHPDDREALARQLDSIVRELSPAGAVQIVSDAQITRGGCRVETQYGVVDQQFEAQLARIEQELGA